MMRSIHLISKPQFLFLTFLLLLNTLIISILNLHNTKMISKNHAKLQEQCEKQLFTLIVVFKDENNESIDTMVTSFKEKLVLGKSIQTTHIAFPYDPIMDDQHCQIIYCNGEIYLEDLSSLTGTYLKEERILERKRIHSGDTIAFGVQSLQILF